MHIAEISAEETHPLRRSVLRSGTASDAVAFDGDELTSTFHLGVVLDGRLVAISSWYERPCPHGPEVPSHQLRGMATDPSVRSTGIGGRLLACGVDICAARDAWSVWARARVSALAFYRRHGFVATGDEYVDATTGLPHRDVVRVLEQRPNSG